MVKIKEAIAKTKPNIQKMNDQTAAKAEQSAPADDKKPDEWRDVQMKDDGSEEFITAFIIKNKSLTQSGLG